MVIISSFTLCVVILSVMMILAGAVAPPNVGSTSVADLKYYDFLPRLVVHFTQAHGPSYRHHFKAHCFRNNTVSVFFDHKNKDVSLSLDASNPNSFFCMDSYVIATMNSVNVKTAVRHGVHDWSFKLNDHQFKDAIANGIYLFHIQDNLIHLVEDIWHTIHLFMGKKSEQENLKFFKEALNIDFVPRQQEFDVDPSVLRPGDIIITTSMTGLSSMISFGTGAATGHVCIVIRDPFTGELLISESQDDAPFQDVDPSPTLRKGITALPFAQWKALEKHANAVVLPLRDDLSKKFNNTAAFNFFKVREHQPYGYHNFFFSFFDTETQTLPKNIDWHFLLAGLKLAESFAKDKIDVLVLEGMRHRLNNYNLNSIEDVTKYLAQQGKMNWAQLMSIPEKDEWLYNGKNELICSAFAVAMLREAGVFEPRVAQSIVATEFTPKDVMQLDIYKKSWDDKPIECGLGDYPICQLLGNYWMPVESWPFYNSIRPYKDMNLVCPVNRTPDMLC
ncbi:hypothetical protein P9112_003117 [Eukaryota sp. TZLM1-RC]